MDSDEGQLLYAKLMLLTIAAIIVPLFVPRVYVPLDPKVSITFYRMASVINRVTYISPRTQ